MQDSQSILQNCAAHQIAFNFLSNNGVNSSDNGILKINRSDDITNSNGIINSNENDGIINNDSNLINSSDNNDSVTGDVISPVPNSSDNLVGSVGCDINYYGSVVSATPSDPPVDAEMSEASDPFKRLLSDVSSSEEPIGEFSSDAPDSAPASQSRFSSKRSDSILAVASKSKVGANKRVARKPKGHLPEGVVSVNRLLSRSKH